MKETMPFKNKKPPQLHEEMTEDSADPDSGLFRISRSLFNTQECQ